jgi:hypothetical protein
VAFSDEVAASTYTDQLHTLLADRYAATTEKLAYHWVEGCYYAYLLSLNDARMHLLKYADTIDNLVSQGPLSTL